MCCKNLTFYQKLLHLWISFPIAIRQAVQMLTLKSIPKLGNSNLSSRVTNRRLSPSKSRPSPSWTKQCNSVVESSAAKMEEQMLLYYSLCGCSELLLLGAGPPLALPYGSYCRPLSSVLIDAPMESPNFFLMSISIIPVIEFGSDDTTSSSWLFLRLMSFH